MNKVLVYTDAVSNRLMYTFDLMLTDLLGLQYELTSDSDFFNSSPLPKFSYAKSPEADEIFFESETLLFEVANQPQPINFCEYEKLRGFYPVSARSRIPFDFFASTFFMVTRYEEYFPHHKDKYDRFRPTHSMNCKGGHLEKPMVNYYALELKKFLLKNFLRWYLRKKHLNTSPPLILIWRIRISIKAILKMRQVIFVRLCYPISKK